MLAYPDTQILDVVGPLEVFSRSTRWLRDHTGAQRDAYAIELLGLERGPFRVSSGLRLIADRAFHEVTKAPDTLMIAGGVGTSAALGDKRLVRWIARMSRKVRRLGSICTGAFLLAEAGLLDGRRATTHWSMCERFAARYPGVRVEADPIFVHDGVYTSAGVTAGMDLALALVEEDLGRDVALAVARELVLFLRRPGGQSQFSAQLAHPLAEREPLRDVQAYVAAHPEADLSVGTLARRADMSPRNFARMFTREVGVTPARFVERARVETARRLLEETRAGLPQIAEASGLGTTESMRRAFLRSIGVPPHAYRQRFAHQERS